MQEIFKRSLELNGIITDMAGKLDIVSIDINSAMKSVPQKWKEM